LRECGKLEEAATNVLLLYWPFKKHMDTKRQTPFEIICAKSRNGSIGKVYLEFAAKQYFFHGHYTPEEWREANKQGGLR
jgi:replicative DNA helicase